MGSLPLSVLMVEDEPAHAEAIRRALARAGTPPALRIAGSLAECRQEIGRHAPDIVLADLNLQDGKALDLLTAPLDEQPFPVLVMTSHGDERTAVQAMKAGAVDYVVKSPEAFADMPRTLERAMREWRLVKERRHAEDALRDALRFSRDVISSAGEGIVVMDRGLRVLVWNQFMEGLTGVPASDLLGKSVADVFPDVHALGLVELVSRALAGETVSSPDVEFDVPAPGRSGWCVITCAPYRTADGRIAGAISTVREITEQRRAAEERLEMERHLLHAQRLESLGILAGGIAHDFNNLLTSILGHAGLTLCCLEPSSRPYHYVEQIEKAAVRAADLTNQMLAYSGRGAFHVAPIELSTLIHEMGELLRTVVPRHIRLLLDCPEGIPTIRGDAAQVRQVVMNLVTNAAEAMGTSHGAVALRTSLADPCRYPGGQAYPGEEMPGQPCVLLEVSDTGCGMDSETLARLFDPFFTTKFAGRGLGMAAVLGIVRGHHGAIRVESEPGQGTSVRVFLPADSRPAIIAPAPRPSWERPDTEGTHTILVVDDEESVRTVARALLEDAGFSVLSAQDGQEAVECYRANADRVAGVLLDLTMPRMRGDEVLSEIRQVRPDVPVVASSGYSEADARRQLGDGANVAFIQKPYQADQLVSALRAALQGHQE